MTLTRFLRVVCAKWVTVVGCALLGVLVAGGVALATPKSYVATSTLLVRWIGDAADTAEYRHAQYAANRATTYALLAERPSVLDRTLDGLKLDITAAELRARVSVVSPGDSSQILVSAISSDSEEAARISNELAAQIAREIGAEEARGEAETSSVDAQAAVEAHAPRAPDEPQVRLLLVSGFLAGVVIGVCWALIAGNASGQRGPSVSVGSGQDPDIRGTLWGLPPAHLNVCHLVLAMLVAATIPWRSDALYEGGADSVVVAKAAISLAATVIAAAMVFRGRGSLYSVPAAPVLVLLAYLVVTVLGGLADGSPQSVVVATRVAILIASVCLLVARYGPQETMRSLVHVFSVMTVAATATGMLSFSGRLGGGFPPLKPNALALLVSVLILWSVAKALSGRDIGLQSFVPIVLLVVLLLTGSRASLVAVVVAALVMLLRVTAVRARTFLMMVAILPILVYVTLGTNILEEVLMRGGQEQVATLSNRTIAWESALTMDRDFWQTWFGQGLAQKKIEVPGQWWDTQLLDSSWISALVQGGYLGVFLVATVSVSTALRAAFAPRAEGALWFGLIVLVTVRGFLESGLFDSSVAFLVFAITALGARSAARSFPTLAEQDWRVAQVERRPYLINGGMTR